MRGIILVEECLKFLGKHARFFEHGEVTQQGKTFNLRVGDSLLHGLPLFRVDDNIPVAVDAQGGHFDLIQHGA